jgi:transglutaminase-like putative cysteine protease
MDRRHFIQASLLASAHVAGLRALSLPSVSSFTDDGWRTFEVTTTIEVLQPSGETTVWLPKPIAGGVPYQRTLVTTLHADGGTSATTKHDADALEIIAVRFPKSVKPIVTTVSRVSTRNYSVDLTASATGTAPASLDYFRRATKLIPTSGIAQTTAREITKGAHTDLEKAQAIYSWIVERTHRNPTTRGCGVGDIRFMLESGDLSGKCADLNALFVGLARASGLPARDVYGLRVAPSKFAYASLGTTSPKITKAQHCRAEVYLSGPGWVPVDPADVRKVALEEPPGNRPLDDDMVKRARARLFGSWEMNWIAYNYAHDVQLPGSQGAPIGFLMYPQAETGGRRVDSLDADAFRYEISAREL